MPSCNNAGVSGGFFGSSNSFSALYTRTHACHDQQLLITNCKVLARPWRCSSSETEYEVTGRLEPNLPLILPILLFGNAQNFYLFCLKLCQCLPIFPEIMPVHVAHENCT